jgi:hypothetical protein
MPAKNLTLMEKYLEENKRLKARVKMLQKLRDRVVITVSDSSGAILNTFTLPRFVYDKHEPAISRLDVALLVTHNQVLMVHFDESLIVCDTFEDLESELNAMNEDQEGIEA